MYPTITAQVQRSRHEDLVREAEQHRIAKSARGEPARQPRTRRGRLVAFLREMPTAAL